MLKYEIKFQSTGSQSGLDTLTSLNTK